MDDMLETMYKAPGIGLAAVNWHLKRVVVIDYQEMKTKSYLFSQSVILEIKNNISL